MPTPPWARTFTIPAASTPIPMAIIHFLRSKRTGRWECGYPGMTNENVTVASGATNVTLNFVVMTQFNAPSLGHPVLSGGQFQFQVTGNGGQNYRIDVSTNLLSNGWTPVYTNMGSFPLTNAVGNQLPSIASSVPWPCREDGFIFLPIPSGLSRPTNPSSSAVGIPLKTARNLFFCQADAFQGHF